MKKRNSISCRNYSRIVSNFTNLDNLEKTWDFGDQRSYRTNTHLPARNIPSYYKLCAIENADDYGMHTFYPGQKVWIIRRDMRNGQYSIDYDFVSEIFAFGEICSKALFHYWLRSYGTGHGVSRSDIFETKAQAMNYMRYYSINRSRYMGYSDVINGRILEENYLNSSNSTE